jgi:hypothetical protein
VEAAVNGQEALFNMGAAAVPDALAEAVYAGPLADVNRHETRVTFVAGMLAQYAWGDAPKKGRPKEQVAASIEAARQAFEFLNRHGAA